MALPWPHRAPTLPVPTMRTTLSPSPARSLLAAIPRLPRVRAVAEAPVTALVAMLLGLVALFALPVLGLPFVALVVLPLIVFHLRADRRTRLRFRR